MIEQLDDNHPPRIPGPEHIEATFTANVPVLLGLTLWEIEYMWSVWCDDRQKGLAINRAEPYVIEVRPRNGAGCDTGTK